MSDTAYPVVDEVDKTTDEAIITPDEIDEVETETADVVTVESLVTDLVAALPTEDQITPYQIHSVVNTAFEALGVDRTIRPQMMYNYAKNGLIVRGSKGQKRFTSDEVIDFVERFVNRNLSK